MVMKEQVKFQEWNFIIRYSIKSFPGHKITWGIAGELFNGISTFSGYLMPNPSFFSEGTT